MGFTVANSEWGNERENTFDLTVAGDHTVFKRRCITAETLVNTKYAAGREWFMNTFWRTRRGTTATPRRWSGRPAPTA